MMSGWVTGWTTPSEGKLTAMVDAVLDSNAITEITAAVAEAVLDEVSQYLDEKLPSRADEITCLESPPPWRWTNSGRPKCSARGSDLVHPGCYRAAALALVT